MKTLLLLAALITIPCFLRAQEPSASPASPPSVATSPAAAPAASPNEAEMMKQMAELAKLGDNHKLLKDFAGTWSCNVQMWMAPGAPPTKSTSTAVTKPIMEGRYMVTDVTGTMKMPGADGKVKDMTFKGMGMDGYDNVKKKFVSSWGDNMGTGIMLMEGDYDPASKTFTYNSEIEMVPGMKTKVRGVVKITDKDHHTFEWYEDHGGQEMKTMQIDYTRKK